MEFLRHPELPGLELRHSAQRGPCFRPHTHDALSVGLIEEGASALTGALDGPIPLAPGDVVVIPAGWVHACRPRSGAWRYLMLHVAPDLLAPLTGLTAELPSALIVRRGDRPAAASLRVLHTALGNGSPAREAQDALVGLLGALGQRGEELRVPEVSDSELLARLEPVLRCLREAPAPPPLAELAASVGMTRSGLIRAIRAATGLPPLAWRQNARVLQARRLLREGRPPARTAQELGFHDQSHLHRVFRAHVAATPGDYRG